MKRIDPNAVQFHCYQPVNRKRGPYAKTIIKQLRESIEIARREK